MSDGIAGLIQSLADERQAYQALLTLATEKEGLLVRNDVEGLNGLVQREIEQLRRIEALDGRREQQAQAVARAYGIESRPLELGMLLEVVPAGERAVLKGLGRQMEQVIEQLAAANEKNRQLLETQIRYNEFFLGLLSGETAQGNMYNHNGYVHSPAGSRPGIINQKV